MTVTEIEAKSILRKHRKIDSWFISQYGMNIYRGCVHNCVYCDGRSEGYYVDGVFGRDVSVKVNAIELLRRELDPKRKRIPMKRSFVMPGGGVGDSYQPVEEHYQLTRKALHVIHEYDFPVHLLTKSTLVLRDIDILRRINEQNGVIVSMSFSSVDDGVSAVFEPGVPPPGERLETLSVLKKAGFTCGMFLLPVIPLITDMPEVMEEAVRKAAAAGLDFVIFGGMTLKEGRQKDYFLGVLERRYPDLVSKYGDIYKPSKWGEVIPRYYDSVNKTFAAIAKKYEMPTRIPFEIYKDILSRNDLVVVMLEQIDYLLKMNGESSSFGYAAYSISQLKEPIAEHVGNLRGIKGVGDRTADVILEIVETGKSSLYEKLLTGRFV